MIERLIGDYRRQICSQSYAKYRAQVGSSWKDYQNQFESKCESWLHFAPSDLLHHLSEDGAISSPLSQHSLEFAIDWHLQTWLLTAIKNVNFYKSLRVEHFNLDDVRYFAYCQKIEKHLLPIRKIKIYLEIGAGNGGFLKFLKIVNPGMRGIIVDLPEVIFSSRLQMAIAFPEKKQVLVLTESELVEALESDDWDFLFLDPSMFHFLEELGLSIDLFVNTRSMGEMRAQATQKFRETLQKLDIANIFLENRFLNPISLSKEFIFNFRRDEYAGSLFMGNLWNIVDFEIEPFWTQSPWEKLHPRYLSLCMKKENLSASPINVRSLTVNQSWRGSICNPWNAVSHPTNIDNFTLRQLFDSCRIRDSRESLVVLLEYINYQFMGKFIEEEQYYFRKLRKLNLLSIFDFQVGRFRLMFKYLIYFCRDLIYRLR